MVRRITRATLGDEIGKVSELNRKELAELWVKAYGCAPPKGVKRKLLERAAANHMQAKVLGGLKPATRKALQAVIHDDQEKSGPTSTQPKPGMRLVREWQGRTHNVDVLEDGFLYKRERFRSLSAVALAITGAKWSGPRFFGL